MARSSTGRRRDRRPPPPEQSRERRAAVLRLARSGLRAVAIARRLAISRQRVYQIIGPRDRRRVADDLLVADAERTARIALYAGRASLRLPLFGGAVGPAPQGAPAPSESRERGA